MSEFTRSYTSLRGSILRAFVYTIGHILIAMSVVTMMTGANIFEAGAVALIEPSINGVWYFVLDRLWVTSK